MKITLIIPMYNCEQTICKLLDSIESQTYSNYEVLLINDGSIDNTFDIVKKYIQGNSKFKLIDITNSGVSYARNIGLKKISSDTDIVLFADSDDELLSNSFQTVVDHMGINDFVIFDYFIEKKRITSNKCNITDKKEFYEYYSDKLLFNQLWNKAYKFSLIKDMFFNKELYLGEDLDFNIRCFDLSKKFAYINKPIYKYYLYTNGLSYKKKKNIMELKTKMYINVDKFYMDNNYDKSYLIKLYQKAYLQDAVFKSFSKKSELIEYNKKNNDIFISKKKSIYSFIYSLIKKNCFLCYKLFEFTVNLRNNKTKKYKKK